MSYLKYLFILLILLCQLYANGQQKVLFEVEGEPVYLDEFLYIYEKTSRDQADFSRESVEEYLDLYIKFKLKVHKAKEMRLDTITSLQNELAGYRKQLANSYLSDREVIESLAREAYERMQQDVDFSHILLKVSPAANEETDEKVYQRAVAILDRLRGGENFEKVALEVSEDGTVKKNEGRIGYVTAMLPDGFYELETAIYNLPLNTNSRPIRSKLGYHIVRVNNRRDARGEMEVSQILVRSGKDKNSKQKIDEIYEQLKSGADFAEMAKSYSEDKATASKGGYLGFFGINKYESVFENTAFRLKEDGDFSRPIRTSIGWHIIKRHSIKPKLTFEEMQRSLETKLRQDERFKIAERAMLEKIKEENGFQQADWNERLFLDEIGDNFLTYQWKAPANYTDQTLANLGSTTLTASDFIDYLASNTANRLRINRTTNGDEALNALYNEFLNDAIVKYEESRLEEKFPEFKALMREYSEGILLFEATKMKVWDRASEDTVGLKAFYRSHDDQYMWPPRALEETITIYDKDISMVTKVVSKLANKPAQKVMRKFNKKRQLISVDSKKVTKEELDPDLEWKKYDMTPPQYSEESQATKLKRIGDLLPAEKKTLDEARGYVIADYQDHLEKEWVADLKDQYKVVVYKDVVESIIKD